MSTQANSGGGAKTGAPGNRQRAAPRASRPASSGTRDKVTENVGPAGAEDKTRHAPRLERDDVPKKDIRVPDDKGAEAGGDVTAVDGQKADDNSTKRIRSTATPNTSWSPSGDGPASPSSPAAPPAGSAPPRPGVIGGMTAESPNFPGKASPRPDGAGTVSSRSPRKAHLILRRVEPWSAMKFSFVVSLVCFVVLFVAVAVLYGVLSALGVFDSIVQTVTQLTTADGKQTGGLDVQTWFEPVRILGYTALIGAVNVVLITALSTLGSVIYNVASDLVGGIEVTFSEAE